MLLDPHPKERREELYDRDDEIHLLKEYSRKYPFSILLGIRRIGKSSILKVVVNESKPAIYIDARKLHFESGGWITSQSLMRDIEKGLNAMDGEVKRALKNFMKSIRGVSFMGLNIRLGKDATLSDILDSLNQYGNVLIAIDEAQYFRFYGRRGGKELLSLISYAYDNLRNIRFIFAGSEIGLLHDFLGIESYESPLYGRVYGEITISPFQRSVARDFLIRGFNEMNMKIREEELEKALDYLDGIPGWLVEFGYNYSITRNFETSLAKVFSKAEKFIAGEIKEMEKRSRRYTLILKAIAMGFNRWERIREFLEARDRAIPNSRLADLLKTLEKMSWIRRENERYRIIDPVVERVIKERFP